MYTSYYSVLDKCSPMVVNQILIGTHYTSQFTCFIIRWTGKRFTSWLYQIQLKTVVISSSASSLKCLIHTQVLRTSTARAHQVSLILFNPTSWTSNFSRKHVTGSSSRETHCTGDVMISWCDATWFIFSSSNETTCGLCSINCGQIFWVCR